MAFSLCVKYDAVFEVNFHLGELYFLLPLLYSIKYERNQKVCIVITNYKIYKNLKEDNILVSAISISPIDLIVLDYLPLKEIKKKQFRKIRHIIKNSTRVINVRLLRYLLIIYYNSLFFVQINGGLVSRLVQACLIKKACKKTLIKFPHSSTPAFYNIVEARKRKFSSRINETDIFLNYSRDSNEYYSLFGFKNFIPVGYHTSSHNWVKLVESYSISSSSFAIIFSYNYRFDVLPREYWEKLHLTTYNKLRYVFGNIRIIIKPHPNQDIKKLEEFIKDKKLSNIELSTNNPMLLSKGAKVAISFLTSGIYNALFNGVPSANYYNAKEIYIENHGHYIHDYRAQGIPDFEDENNLEKFLIDVKNNNYTCGFSRKYNETPKINSLTELLKAVANIT